MIGIDWGTSSFRAFRLADDGSVLERRTGPRGILRVPPGGFADALRAEVGDWLAADRRVLLSGMVGSRQGWQEAAYLPCPAGPAELAAGLSAIAFDGAVVRLVPGLEGRDASGVPEVMRGEETQIAGVLAELGPDALICLPGSHAKWVRLRAGRIAGFITQLTGEAFAALRDHTILGRLMRDGPPDAAAFDRGLARAAEPGGLLHHLFGVRTLGLSGELAEAAASSYLSGLLIGHEVRAVLPAGEAVALIGAAPLCAAYSRAIVASGGTARVLDEDAAARGLFAIGKDADWNERRSLPGG